MATHHASNHGDLKFRESGGLHRPTRILFPGNAIYAGWESLPD